MPSKSWDKTKGYSKKGFDKAWAAIDKLGGPVNRLSNRVGSEAFWPMVLDKESDKAARILRSFCKDGFYANEEDTGGEHKDANGKIDRPKGKQRVIKKIPTKVIQRAKGLAIFTTMRTGLWLSGSGGSGVLLARIPETDEWSPPSGIMLHTAAVGFLAGVDIYDCVVVINTYEALEAFKKVRCTLGGEVSATAGPVGVGGVLDSEVHKRQSPIWTYMKSRGLYAGVQVDGTIIIERTDENERFYGERISVTDILAGKVRHPPPEINGLIQTVKAAQGDMDVDESLLPPPGETPGDLELPTADTAMFGIPAADDPDPYGVRALEAQGLMIREAGTNVTPGREAFDFRPSSGSPIFANFSRHSLDSSPRTSSPRASWRVSGQSYASADRGTQTDCAPATAPTSISRASSRSNKDSTVEPHNPWDGEEGRWDTIPLHGQGYEHHDYDSDKDFVDDAEFEVHEVSSATVSKRESFANMSPTSLEDPTAPPEVKRQSPTFTRARLVTIPKRPNPPALPPRNPPALPPRNPTRFHPETSTPGSPISQASPTPDDTRSVASGSDHGAMNGFSELPLDLTLNHDHAPSISSHDGLPATVSTDKVDKDEFHSVSSEPESESEDHTNEPVPAHVTNGVKEDVVVETKPETTETADTPVVAHAP